ncbi:MAG: glycosyltransferase, partial [Caldisericum exile]
MENLGLISVIMPVFNSEKYLKGAIESVLNQTYPY